MPATGVDKATKVTGATAGNLAALGADGDLADSGSKAADFASASALDAKAPTSRTISTTAPLTGGGDLSADRTLSIAAASATAAGSMSAADKSKLDGIAAGATANAGTVTSVDLANATGTSFFTVAGGPVTAAGSITLNLANQLPNRFLAGPTSGTAAGAVTARPLIAADIPATLASHTFTGAAVNDAAHGLRINPASLTGGGAGFNASFRVFEIGDFYGVDNTELGPAHADWADGDGEIQGFVDPRDGSYLPWRGDWRGAFAGTADLADGSTLAAGTYGLPGGGSLVVDSSGNVTYSGDVQAGGSLLLPGGTVYLGSGSTTVYANQTGTAGVGTFSFQSPLTVNKPGIGTTSTDGLVVKNSTAGSVQYSPRLYLLGNGRNTASSTDVPTCAYIEVQAGSATSNGGALGNVVFRAGAPGSENTWLTYNPSSNFASFGGSVGVVQLQASSHVIVGGQLRVTNALTPASATASGTAGTIAWDGNYIYVCVAANTWRRVAHASW